MRSYIKNTLKRFLPFYIVFAAILFSMALMYLSSEDSVYFSYIYCNVDECNEFLTRTPYSGLLILLIPTFFLVCIAPLIANYYRYSLRSVDLYYQTGKGNKTIRYVHNLVLLSMILIIFTGIYAFTMLFIFIKQIPYAGMIIEDTYYREVYIFSNYQYYALAYIPSILSIIVTYFISYFFVTRSNNFINSLITLVGGHLIIGFSLLLPYVFYNGCVGPINENITINLSSYYMGLKSFSPFSYMIFINNIFNPLIIGSNIKMFEFGNLDAILAFIHFIIGLVLMFALTALGIVYFILEKESSGEYAGKPVGRDKLQEIIFHSTFIIGSFELLIVMNQGILGIFNSIFSFATCISLTAVYFALSGLIRRRFKWNWKEWTIFGSLSASTFLLSLALLILNTVGYIINHPIE